MSRYAITPNKAALETVARHIDPVSLREILSVAGTVGIGGAGAALIDGYQDEEQSIIDNALIEALGTGAIASGVGAGAGYLHGNRRYRSELDDAKKELTKKKVRARDIQMRSPNASRDVPMLAVANASNKVKDIKGRERTYGMRGAKRAAGVSAAGAALVNLINAFRDEAPDTAAYASMNSGPGVPADENSGVFGAGVLSTAGLGAATIYTLDEMERENQRQREMSDRVFFGDEYSTQVPEPITEVPPGSTEATKELLRRKSLR